MKINAHYKVSWLNEEMIHHERKQIQQIERLFSLELEIIVQSENHYKIHMFITITIRIPNTIDLEKKQTGFQKLKDRQNNILDVAKELMI